MNTWKQFTQELTEDELIQIVKDYKIFQRDGSIGECLLRSKADEWSRNINSSMVIFEMTNIASFAFEFYANKYFDMMGINVE